MGAETYEEAL